MDAHIREIETWLINSVMIPQTPILVTAGFSLLQETAIQYQDILGRTEIYMVSVIMLATTKRDIDDAHVDNLRDVISSRLVKWLTPILIVISMTYGVIFFQVNVTDISISKLAIANSGTLLAMFTFVWCLPIQRRIKLARLANAGGNNQ